MSIPKVTKKKADGVGLGIFLVGIGILMYLNTWWPEIMIVIGVSLATKQFLRGREYDMIITALVCGGAYFYYKAPLPWHILMPVLFVVGGVYLIARELLFRRWREGKEEMEDVRMEIQDADEHDK